MTRLLRLPLCLSLLSLCACASAGANFLPDPSFEQPKDKDRWGLVFTHWGGWIYEGECEFRVSDLAHTGQHSLLMVGGNTPKIRARPASLTLEPGRYRITAYLRGLDIGTGVWNQTTEFMFAENYLPLNKNGTFGWTQLTYVGEIKEKRGDSTFSFGLMAPGYLWVDDVSVEKVGPDVPLTPAPVLGPDAAPITPPGELHTGWIRCSECGYRNMPQWGKCYACGVNLPPVGQVRDLPTRETTKLIAGFEDTNPFGDGTVVSEHATQGAKALRIDRSYVSMDTPQDWTGYDYLKLDVYTEATDPMDFYLEVRDTATRDYWTRVNYNTVVPPGASTLIIPTKQLYVGEKSRPGRMLLLANITRLVFSIHDQPPAPLFVDNVRLERDTSTQQVLFDGLHAFDFGLSTSPVMEGFTPVTPATLYSPGRGYGLLNARVWRAYDALQPEPLYQDFLCLESGGLAVDLPNGRYQVFLNLDNPSGFWGEYQTYSSRTVLAEGQPVITDTMDLETLTRKYFRFWDTEDLPTDNTFDKYQRSYYDEKSFEVEVADGQLNLDFQGENWGCSLSAVVIYPLDKAAQGRRFLQYVEDRRRFHFDNYFKRVLHRPARSTPTGTLLPSPTPDEQRGYVVFTRDYMQDVYYNDTPRPGEIGELLTGEAFAGEMEPLTLSVRPLRDLGKVTVTASDLTGPAGTIPARAIHVGHVSYRVSRVTMEGSVYTISPRLIMPRNSVAMPQDITRRFWLTVNVPADAKPGLYQGLVKIAPEHAAATEVPVQFRVRKGTLDAVDLPVGPWGHAIDLPWPGAEAQVWNDRMTVQSLRRLREYGFTSFSGLPVVSYQGFRDGQPVFDFTTGDAQMKRARELGFALPVVNYAPFSGLNLYFQDTEAMRAAGFSDYSQFIKSVFTAVQQHADAQQWLPVYWNLGDEPLGDAVTAAAENAAAYRKAFPHGPPLFTAATSFTGSDPNDPHYLFAKQVHVPDLNGHDEAAIKLLHAAGDDWGFYNGANRWTYGVYLYKAAKQFGLKFRLSWHWNVVAGDPYYALDCREDDYAWCNASPQGELIPAIHFEQLREGLDDYRRLLTLSRLAHEKPNTPAAKSAQQLLTTLMAAFKLGDRDESSLKSGWSGFRKQVDDAIESLR